MDEAIRSLQRQIDEKEQTLSLDLPDDLPPIWADPSRLAQILVNMVSNATKYTPQEGQIYVGAQPYATSDDELAGAAYVHIWVKDTGIGISQEDQVKIFQQYFRTDEAKEAASGTGLGLNITKSLIEMQGGRIWFESEPNLGTTFHFILPVAESETA
jgi:signal transduction histidine kinase